MRPLSFQHLAEMAGGTLVHGPADRNAIRVCSDSRHVLPGDLFIALRGDQFDGHAFIPDAAKKGAVAALIHADLPTENLPPGFGLIRVADTLAGLQRLAAAYRATLPVRTVAITGSNGKTSTKEFTAAVLQQSGSTRKTQGNLNNHIGVPLTLLTIEPSDRWAVVEMGMNHPGELRPLAAMTRPEFGIITAAGWAHIEHFTDREAIAREKAEVAFAVPASGHVFLQGDNPRLRAIAPEITAPITWVGTGAENTVRVEVNHLDASGTRFTILTSALRETFHIPAPGPHMAENAALAIALGLHIGLTPEAIREGLAAASLPKGRLALEPYRQGWLLDDSYNASPDSMAAAFRTLMALPGSGRGVALLGSMGELGARAEELHRWVGQECARAGFSRLLALGPGAPWLVEGARSGGLSADAFNNHEELAAAYLAESRPDDRILIKGSRSQTMERVTTLLKS